MFQVSEHLVRALILQQRVDCTAYHTSTITTNRYCSTYDCVLAFKTKWYVLRPAVNTLLCDDDNNLGPVPRPHTYCFAKVRQCCEILLQER